MRIAITGGTGFLGYHLILRLLEMNLRPTVIARGVSRTGEKVRKLSNIDFRANPNNDESKFFQAFQGCDVVAHLAGINREHKPGDFQNAHVETTMKVVHAARKAMVKKIVFVSYLKARPRCLSKYHETKWQAEEIIRSSALDYTILKPGMVFGPGDHMLSHISRGIDTFHAFAAVGILEPKVRPIYVGDMVEVLAATLFEDRLSGQTVAVMGAEELTLSACVKRVARAKKTLALVFPAPTLLHLALASLMEKASSDPLVTVAQIRMLAEGMNKPLAGCDDLPEDLQPRTRLTEELIREALAD